MQHEIEKLLAGESAEVLLALFCVQGSCADKTRRRYGDSSLSSYIPRWNRQPSPRRRSFGREVDHIHFRFNILLFSNVRFFGYLIQYHTARFAKPLGRCILNHFFGDLWIVTLQVPAIVTSIAKHNRIVDRTTAAAADLAEGVLLFAFVNFLLNERG